MHQRELVTKISHLLNLPEEVEKHDSNNISSQRSTTIKLPRRDRDVVSQGNKVTKNVNDAKKIASKANEIVKSESSSSNNPALNSYNQTKQRSVAPFDLEQVQNTKLLSAPNCIAVRTFHEKSGLYYHISQEGVPVFYVTRLQVPDPVVFYEMIEDLGSHYGCIKLQFCDENGSKVYNSRQSWSKFGFNTEQFGFKARTQCLNSSKVKKSHILDFHKQLYRYHTQFKGSPRSINKTPSIDKRTLDLYRLWKCVQLRGGYEEVCQKKLWAQIGRELGYSGRIMSSLSTSLRSAYVKILLDFEIHQKEVGKRSQTDDSNDQPKSCLITRPASKHSECRALDEVYEVVSSASELTMMRDVKLMKGYSTNFDLLTENKVGLTQWNEETLPGYDFTLWQTGTETYDAKVYENKSSPVYNLKQYHEKSQRHLQDIEKKYACIIPELLSNPNDLPQQRFEELFYHILSDTNSSHEVDTGLNLTSTLHGFSYPHLSKDKSDLKHAIDAWNLDNLPLHEKSLLQFMELDMGNYTRTTVDIGMLFSVQGWRIDGNFLPSIDYNHLGSSKLWYVIPPEDLEKFEELILTINSKMSANFDDHSVEENFEDGFKKSEFYKCYVETYQSTSVRNSLRRSNLHELIGNEVDLSLSNKLPIDLQITPDTIRRHGIRLYKVAQECGSYIFKFPKTYSSNVASGFYVSEHANFAPASWLKHIIEGSIWLQDNGFLPGLQPFQFLMNIILNSKDGALVGTSRDNLKDAVTKELQNRARIREILGSDNMIINRFDYISDLSMKATGCSKIILADEADCISVSAEEFLDRVEKKEDGKWYIFGRSIGGNDSLSIDLHIYYSDELLESIYSKNDGDATSCENRASFGAAKVSDELNNLINARFDGKRVPIDSLKQLASKVDISSAAFSSIRGALNYAETLILDSKDVLNNTGNESHSAVEFDIGKGFNLFELPISQEGYDAELLQILHKKLQKCSVEFPEMQQVLNLCENVLDFQSKAKEALRTRNLLQLKDAYIRARSLPIKSKYTAPLVHWICKLKWLEVYDDIFVEGNNRYHEDPSSYSLHLLHSFLKFGIKHCGVENMQKLQKVRSVIIRSQDFMAKISKILKNKRPHSNILIEDIRNILQIVRVENLPLDITFVKSLEEVVDSVDRAKKEMLPLSNLLVTNEVHIDELQKLIDSNSQDAKKLFCNFDGSASDKRIPVTDVMDQKILTKQIKVCKLWMNKVNKICAKSKREKWRRCISECLDMETDKYIPFSDPSGDKVLYCFCRQRDIGSTMVECEICKEWYHTTCINQGNWKLPDENNSVFVCPLCSWNEDKPNHDETYADYPTISSLITESLSLKLLPDRKTLADMFHIFSALLAFRHKMIEDLFQDGQFNSSISIHKIKYYLRKIEKSKCDFSNLTLPLKNYCRKLDSETLKSLRDKNTIIVTGQPEPVIKQELPQKQILKETTTTEQDAK